MKRPKRYVDYGGRMTQQEMNVDSNIESTRGTHKVKRIEIIDGKKYMILDVHSWYERKNENNLTNVSGFDIIVIVSERSPSKIVCVGWDFHVTLTR